MSFSITSHSLEQKPSTGEFLSSSQVACLQVPWAAPLLKWWHRVSSRAELVHRLRVIWIFGSLSPTNQKLPHSTSSLLRIVPSQRVLKHDTWVRNICHSVFKRFQNAARVPVYPCFPCWKYPVFYIKHPASLAYSPEAVSIKRVSRAACSTSCPSAPSTSAHSMHRIHLALLRKLEKGKKVYMSGLQLVSWTSSWIENELG